MNKAYRCRQGQQTEKEIYLYFVRYFRKHGYSPSYEEIGEALETAYEELPARRSVEYQPPDGTNPCDIPDGPGPVGYGPSRMRLGRPADRI